MKEKILKKGNKGITLIALIVTIIVLIILAGITINLLFGENGIIKKAQVGGEEYKIKEAKEIMNLKIVAVQIESYAESKELPNLQYLADKLCEDNDIEYVRVKEGEVASLEKVTVGENKSILTKMKVYPFEFEINQQLQLASIDGIQVAAEPEAGYMRIPTETLEITENGEYDVINKARVNVNVQASGNSNTQNESDDSNYASADISDFELSVKQVVSTSLAVEVNNIETTNNVNISGYIWMLNNKVAGLTQENKFNYHPLESNTSYNIKVIAVDEDGKVKISQETSVTTSTWSGELYNHGNQFTEITGGFKHVNRTNYDGCTATFNADNIYINAKSNGGGRRCCFRKKGRFNWI